MLMWAMSDRALPRSYATMEGFGVHTSGRRCRGRLALRQVPLEAAEGRVCSLWYGNEANLLMGRDPDFNRRDSGRGDRTRRLPGMGTWFAGRRARLMSTSSISICSNATKIIPEELVPIRRVGKLTLNRNGLTSSRKPNRSPFTLAMSCLASTSPTIRYCWAALLLYRHATPPRVGPNFHELPINRSLRRWTTTSATDSAHHDQPGKCSYFPNSLGGGCPMHSPTAAAAFPLGDRSWKAGAKLRQRSESFSDHFSQATMFLEQHERLGEGPYRAAFSFELNMVVDQGVRNRVMNELLCNISPQLPTWSQPPPASKSRRPVHPRPRPPSAPTPSGPLNPKAAELRSPALSMDKPRRW